MRPPVIARGIDRGLAGAQSICTQCNIYTHNHVVCLGPTLELIDIGACTAVETQRIEEGLKNNEFNRSSVLLEETSTTPALGFIAIKCDEEARASSNSCKLQGLHMATKINKVIKM
jgi:hypothetical protein